ncbi:MAG: hypothetical protein KJ052_01440, partial [Candidatus Hydrogenedentes bacterium]|nr:hypothetical protein [Candidatus Hydrogenedentota bacterium]
LMQWLCQGRRKTIKSFIAMTYEVPIAAISERLLLAVFRFEQVAIQNETRRLISACASGRFS